MSKLLDKIFLRWVRVRVWYDHRMMLAWQQYFSAGGQKRLHSSVVARAADGEGAGVPWPH